MSNIPIENATIPSSHDNTKMSSDPLSGNKGRSKHREFPRRNKKLQGNDAANQSGTQKSLFTASQGRPVVPLKTSRLDWIPFDAQDHNSVVIPRTLRQASDHRIMSATSAVNNGHRSVGGVGGGPMGCVVNGLLQSQSHASKRLKEAEMMHGFLIFQQNRGNQEGNEQHRDDENVKQSSYIVGIAPSPASRAVRSSGDTQPLRSHRGRPTASIHHNNEKYKCTQEDSNGEHDSSSSTLPDFARPRHDEVSGIPHDHGNDNRSSLAMCQVDEIGVVIAGGAKVVDYPSTIRTVDRLAILAHGAIVVDVPRLRHRRLGAKSA